MALMTLDLKLYFKLQPFAVQLVTAVLLGLHYRNLPYKKVIKLYIYIVVLMNYFVYLVRIF